jgi:hypothetical protein
VHAHAHGSEIARGAGNCRLEYEHPDLGLCYDLGRTLLKGKLDATILSFYSTQRELVQSILVQRLDGAAYEVDHPLVNARKRGT